MRTLRRARIAIFILAAAPTIGLADDHNYTLELPDPVASLDQRQPVTENPAQQAPAQPAPARFGDQGTDWWDLSAGVAYNFVDSTDWNLRLAWSHFIIENVEFSVELNGWYFNQPGDNAFGINPAFVFRWHFINTGNWSVYADAGIGILLATSAVPEGGTNFDFMPRIGGGFTYKLDDRGDRLQVGLRWHHVSNARIEGDFNNPARDGLMFYTGLMFPF